MSDKNSGRICLECQRCYVSGGSQGYSEYTPSSPFEMECRKGHDIGYHNHDTTKSGLREGIQRARTCPDFKEAK